MALNTPTKYEMGSITSHESSTYVSRMNRNSCVTSASNPTPMIMFDRNLARDAASSTFSLVAAISSSISASSSGVAPNTLDGTAGSARSTSRVISTRVEVDDVLELDDDSRVLKRADEFGLLGELGDTVRGEETVEVEGEMRDAGFVVGTRAEVVDVLADGHRLGVGQDVADDVLGEMFISDGRGDAEVAGGAEGEGGGVRARGGSGENARARSAFAETMAPHRAEEVW